MHHCRFWPDRMGHVEELVQYVFWCQLARVVDGGLAGIEDDADQAGARSAALVGDLESANAYCADALPDPEQHATMFEGRAQPRTVQDLAVRARQTTHSTTTQEHVETVSRLSCCWQPLPMAVRCSA
jgi:hypothetical protein